MDTVRKTIIVASTALCFFLPDAAADTRARDIFVATSPGVFRIQVLDGAGNVSGSQSAVLWRDGHLVSRCAGLGGSYELPLADQTVPLKLQSHDPDSRLCLLHVEWPDWPPSSAPEIAEPPETGGRVFAVGNIVGLGIGISEGVVSAIHRRGDATRIQFTAPISDGSEGGGLFDGNGRLVGIIDQPLQGGQNVNIAVPASSVQSIVERAAAHASETAEHDKWMAQARALRQREAWSELRSHADAFLTRHPDNTEALVARAEALIASTDLDTAVRDLERALSLDHEHRAARFALLRVQIARQDSGAAVTARALTETWPGDTDAWIARAQAQAAIGDHDDADASARQALTLHPWSVAALDLLARTAQARNRTDEWIRHRARLFDLYPGSPRTLMSYADALLAVGRAAQVLALIDRFPDYERNGDLLYYRGRALQSVGRPSDALRSFELSLDHAPLSPAWVWAGIGGIHYVQGSWAPAIAAYRNAVALDRSKSGWRWSLGVALKDAGQAAEALEIFSALVTESPQRADAWQQLGFVQTLLNQPDPAIVALERSLALDARQPKVWHALIELYSLKGRNEDIRRAWGRLLELDPRRAEAARLCCILPLDIVE